MVVKWHSPAVGAILKTPTWCSPHFGKPRRKSGLPPGLVEIVGPLSPLVSKHGIMVTPYVGLIPDFVEYRPNDAEIAAVFSVPLEFFRQDIREHTHRIDYQGRSWYVPSYRYGEYKIWGLTAIMIVELINVIYDSDISLHRPPEHSVI